MFEYIARNGEDLKYDDINEDEKYELTEYICANPCWQGDHECY